MGHAFGNRFRASRQALIPDPLWVSELQQAYDLQWIWDQVTTLVSAPLRTAASWSQAPSLTTSVG